MGSYPYPKDATFTKYVLRVVSTQSTSPRGDQDVSVLAQAEQIGQWSASGEQAKPYSVDFEPKNDSSPDSAILTLQTESENADWDYHGGGAKEAADRPRLIVTYEVPSPPAISRSGQAHRPSTSLSLPDGTQLQLRANSVLYEGAEYLIARPDDTQRLYRVAAGGVTDWQLAGIDVTAKSFAFVTAWGRLQIITKDAIGSCDLEKLGEQGSVVTCMVNEAPQFDQRRTRRETGDGTGRQRLLPKRTSQREDRCLQPLAPGNLANGPCFHGGQPRQFE
jgi:hypothetical protein